MPETVISSVQLVLPDRILDNGWVRLEGGIIRDFGQAPGPASDNSVNGRGMFLAPGLVDTHVHGGNGCDYLDATPDAFRTIAAYHLSRGTTSLCPTLATATYEHLGAALDVWSSVKNNCGARILGVHLEGPHLAVTKAGAQNPKLLRPPTNTDIAWLVENAAHIAQMTIAPELPMALELIRSCAKAGIVLSAGHTEARDEIALASTAQGVTKVTHLFNAMTYAAKSGQLRQAGLVEYALVDDNLGCELIADGFHAPPVLMNLALRCKGPHRIALVSDALAGTGLPVGYTFMLGALPCRVADGVCMLADGSALAGSATTLFDQVRLLHQKLNVPLADAIRMASQTPASLLRVDDKYGSIARGKAADFVQFDDSFRIHGVWVNGAPVGPHSSSEQPGAVVRDSLAGV